MEDMKDSSGGAEIGAALLHQAQMYEFIYFEARTRIAWRATVAPCPTVFTGWVGGSHRTICKQYKHHFLLLVLICGNSFARQMGSYGEINWGVLQKKCRRNFGNKLQLFTFLGGYAERLDGASR